MPITWKNINAPDLRQSADIMDSAAKLITGGLGKLSSTATDLQNQQFDRWDQTKDVNTQQLLNRINTTDSMDALNQLKSSLTPQQLQQQFGAQVDTAQLMNALQSRVGTIQDNETNAFNYQNTLAQRAAQPFRKEFDALVAANKLREAQSYFDANKDKLFDQAGAASALRQAQLNQEQLTNARQDRDFNLWQRGNTQAAALAADGIDTIVSRFNYDQEDEAYKAYEDLLNASKVDGKERADALATFRDQFRARTGLSAQGLAGIETGTANRQAEIDFAKNYFDQRVSEAEKRVTEEDIKAWTESGNQAYSDIKKDINSASGVSKWYTFDDADWFFTDMEAGRNVGDTIDNEVRNLQDSILRGKDPGELQILSEFNGEIPGAVVRKAFDELARDYNEDGSVDEIDTSRFGDILREKMDAYIRFRANNANVNKLRNERDQSVFALEKGLRDFQAQLLAEERRKQQIALGK